MMKFLLPMPPSVWSLYVGWGKTRRLSPEYRKWRNDAGWFVKPIPAKPIDVPFSVGIAISRECRKPGMDIDNFCKAPVDILQHMKVIKNDNLCERLTIQWATGLQAECVVILQVAKESLAA